MKVGLIGYGSMGSSHASQIVKHEGVDLVAVADLRPDIRKKALKDHPGIRLYETGDELIEAGGYDVVFVVCPTYFHCQYACKAMEAGFHVFCEKPMALTVEECDRMLEVHQRTGKIFMIGLVLHFWPEYVYLKKVIDEGTLGKLHTLSMCRVGNRSTGWENWYLDEERGGGQIFDRHIHDADAIMWILGAPKAVRAFGVDGDRRAFGGICHSMTQYEFDPSILVTAEGSADTSRVFPFTATFRAFFEKGVLEYDGTRKENTLMIYDEAGKPEPAELPKPMQELDSTLNLSAAGPYFYEEEYFFDCVRKGVQATAVDGFEAREAVRLVRLEAESVRSGKTMEF